MLAIFNGWCDVTAHKVTTSVFVPKLQHECLPRLEICGPLQHQLCIIAIEISESSHVFKTSNIESYIHWENASHIYCCCDVTAHSQSHYISVWTKIARGVPAMTGNMWTSAMLTVILWPFRYQRALFHSKQVMLKLIFMENALLYLWLLWCDSTQSKSLH